MQILQGEVFRREEWFLEHLGGYGSDVRGCPEATSDAIKFARLAGKDRVFKKEIKIKRTQALVTDDLKISPQQNVKRLIHESEIESQKPNIPSNAGASSYDQAYHFCSKHKTQVHWKRTASYIIYTTRW